MALLVLKYFFFFFVKSIGFVAKEVIVGAEHSKRLDVWTFKFGRTPEG